jgi:hypothetical protein
VAAEQAHTCAYEDITPEDAKQMLAAGNRRNRKLSPPAVRRIMAIIERGEWMSDSTDAIGLASDNSVVNGQHRLEAISQGNETVRALVVRGVRPEVVKIIDQGMSRSLAQQLTIDGRYTEPSTTATAAEWMYKMVGHFEKSMPTEYKPTIPQLLDLLGEHPHLVDSLDMAGEANRVTPKLTKGILTAYHYAFACADADLADEFFSQLASGLDVVDYSPVYVLREKYIDDQKKADHRQMKRPEAAAFLVMAWEATRRGEALTTRQLKFVRAGAKATAVPTVSDVSWLHAAADESGGEE